MTKFRILQVSTSETEYLVQQWRLFYWSNTYFYHSGAADYYSQYSTLECATHAMLARVKDTQAKQAGRFWRRKLKVVREVNTVTHTTYHTAMINGVPVGVPNVTESPPDKRHYVSYNNHDRAIYGCDTTAIVVQRSSAFLILNGDHRAALRGLSFEDACVYFHANVDKKNMRSDSHEDDFLQKVDGKWKMVRVPPGPQT